MRAPYTLIGDNRDYAIDGYTRIVTPASFRRPHPIDADCIGCWRMDESLATQGAIDASSNGLDMSVAAGTQPAVGPGAFNGARRVAGTVYFTRGDSALLKPANVSVMGWVKFVTPPSPGHYIALATKYSNWEPMNFRSWGADIYKHANGSVSLVGKFGVGAAGAFAFPGGAELGTPNIPVASLTDGEFHHWAVTYNETTGWGYSYWDGALVGSEQNEETEHLAITYSHHVMRIGYGSVSPVVWVDDVALYGADRNLAWIQDIALEQPEITEWVPNGQLARDPTIASRCRARVLCHRGKWAVDPAFGSRLWTLKTMKRARHLAVIYIEEALADLIAAKEIEAIRPLEFVEDHRTGALGVRVEVVLPREQIVPLGVIPLGE